MAQIQATQVFRSRNDVIVYEWVALTDSDTAAAVAVPQRADKTIQASGNFGTGGDIRVEGSLDPDQSVFSELVDPQGNPIAFLAAGIETILENVIFIRPVVAVGTGVSVTVRILMS